MKTRFYLLALLSGLFLIVALPIGILFLAFLLLYYYASKREETVILEVEPTKEDKSEFPPDYHKLFNGSEYILEQEKLR